MEPVLWTLYIVLSYFGMYYFLKHISRKQQFKIDGDELFVGLGFVFSPIVAPIVLFILGSWRLGYLLFYSKQ